MAERDRLSLNQLFTPRRAFGLLAILIFGAVLFAPRHDVSDENATLSSYLAHPNGARGLHDVLDRLGFTVQRRLRPMREPLAAHAVYVVLDPPVDLTAIEVHNVLEAVRAGAGLLVALPFQSRLADSLQLRRVPEARLRATDSARSALRDTTSLRGRRLLRHVLRQRVGRLDSTVVLVPGSAGRVFESLQSARGREPVIVGLPFGRGRVLAAAEPDLFSNEVLRRRNSGVRVVRMMEWLTSGDSSPPIVFDEYHHGHGQHASIIKVTQRALTETRAGRTLLQLALAGLVLLVALGVRPVRPRVRSRIERRSALEHVGALARAYAAVRARAQATRLLVRGLRRRHGGLRGRPDEVDYLQAIAEQHPHVRADVAQVIQSLDSAPAQRTDANETTAILRIERAITS
ncbi:MAG: DUF4350 domain-containing protein [Longimicrobiales bacterium]